MEYALYPGCIVLYQMQEYERSTRAVFGRLGIGLYDIEKACCCGALLEDATDEWLALPAYNMALVEKSAREKKIPPKMLTLCGACTSAMRHAKSALSDEKVRARFDRRLARIGLEYRGEVEVMHVLELLYYNRSKLKNEITQKLHARCAVSHPCQVFYGKGKSRYEPEIMRTLVEQSGAHSIEYSASGDCCGSTLLMLDEKFALQAGRRKMRSAREAHADIVVDACGNCHLLFDRYSSEIGALPTVFITQLLGASLGLSAKSLGLRRAVYEAL